MARVLIIDDDALVRRLLGRILTAQGVEVVGEAADGDEAVSAVQAHRPDVVLMDLRMARMQGAEATAAVRALPDAPGVIALTSFDTDDAVLRAVRAGATGFLPKDASPEDIVAAVEAVAEGGGALAPRAARYVVERLARDGDDGRRAEAQRALSSLSAREREVATALTAGRSNAEIAAQMFCSEATVKTYLSRAMAKLDVTNRTQLALIVDRASVVPGDA